MRAVFTAFNSLSLARQFLIAGGAITFGAMLLIGIFVTDLIAQAVTRNSAAATALYVDSIIAPILPDMTTTEQLDESVVRVLDETLGQGALGKRLMSFRLWRADGTVLYSNDKRLMGQRIPPDSDLKAAFSGHMVAEFELDQDEEVRSAVVSNEPILEIYNPVLQPWSGEVVAVAEFYERASDLNRSLAAARFRSWTAVALVTTGFFLVLSIIVLRGSRTIDRQKRLLNRRVEELSQLLRQNRELNKRVQKSAQRAAALNERFLHRISADLHDGPAQLVAFASLRIDSDSILNPDTPLLKRETEIRAIKHSLDEAIAEIRSICQGLTLPDIESLSVPDVLSRVVATYRTRTGANVELLTEDVGHEPSHSVKICVYRFVQEALNNGWRHASGKGQRVEQRTDDNRIVVTVSDQGPGFDRDRIRVGSFGLSGLKERVESLGGRFTIASSPEGTVLTMILEMSDTQTD